MKNKKLICIIICVFLLTSVCLGAGKALLSPGLEHIEKNLTLKKCTVYGSEVSFSKTDFDRALCGKPEFIKIETLPDTSHGILYLGTLRISENQIVEREDFDKIVFTSLSAKPADAEFIFSDRSGGLSVNCVIHMLEKENLSPVSRNQTVNTAENIAALKFLTVEDPENDAVSFEVVSYPSHGTVRISDESSGYFSYTPRKGFYGVDSFEYVATDIYGNRSPKATVKINVSENASDIYFDDLKNHWAHNSAVKTASMGLMKGEYDSDGLYVFNPDKAVSRGDFLAMALICAGKEPEIEFVTKTAFDDDASIPLNIKSYVEYARRCGIVSGYTLEDGSQVFSHDEPITRAEAAVITERILNLPDTGEDISVFSDFSAVPSWASGAISKLNAFGILKGTGFGELMPDSHVTKAQTAEMLCNILDFAKSHK